jgi:hypothetical protein
MPDIVADPPLPPALTCFSKPEIGNLNHLVLISFRLARDRL